MLIDDYLRRSLDEAIGRRIERAKLRQLRSMERFAEDEIIIPSGRYEDAHFRCDRQPFTKRWFQLVDSHRWRNMVATGPVQASKTLCCSTIPVAYHLFEIVEPVIYAVPSGEMAKDKWRVDIKPVIEKTRFRDLMPESGSGSKGGDITSITFKNGAMLRFMGSGGDDATRAGFTTRVVVMTEMDKFAVKSTKSQESNPYTQVRDRLASYDEEAIFYGETTVSTDQGIVWSHWKHGTGTVCYMPCHSCHQFVRPEREHLKGWQNTKTIYDAKKHTKIHCPACGAPWTEEQRREANHNSIALHRGQEIKNGSVIGPTPDTEFLSFRWTCVDNHLTQMQTIGGIEWDALYGAGSENPDNSELMIRQKYWAIPPDPEEMGQPAEFKPFALMRRLGPKITKGPSDMRIIPDWADALSAGVDCKMRFLHYVVHAWGEGGRSQIIDYGVEEVQYALLGIERGIYEAVLALADKFTEGYEDEYGDREYIQRCFIDSNYQRNSVISACLEMKRKQEDTKCAVGLNFDKRIYWPIIGYGLSTDERNRYTKPRTTGPAVLKIGLGSYQGKVNEKGVMQTVINIDVDHWKTDVRNRLACSVDDPTAMTFYWTQDPGDHLSLAKHLCAETPHIEFEEGKGYVQSWLRKNRNNHYLDATTYSRTAAWWMGVRTRAEAAGKDENSTTNSAMNGSTNGNHPTIHSIAQMQEEVRRSTSYFPNRR